MKPEFQAFLNTHHASVGAKGGITYPTNTPNKKYLPKTYTEWEKSTLEIDRVNHKFEQEKARLRGEVC